MVQNLSKGFVTLFLKVYLCFVAQRKRVRPITGRSEDRNLPKQIQALAQFGRAFDCSGIQTSNSRWFDSGKPETTTFHTLCGKSGAKSIGDFVTLFKSVFGRIVK